MATSTIKVEVRLPKKGDAEFEQLAEDLAEAVYQKVKERLALDEKSAPRDISDA